MSNQLEPQGSDCDAPSYSVVRACEGLGFHAPLDVPWRRMRHYLAERVRQRSARGLRAWTQLFGKRQPLIGGCACGHPLPLLERYTFTFRSRRQAIYLLGQCRVCRTIYWDEALSARRLGP